MRRGDFVILAIVTSLVLSTGLLGCGTRSSSDEDETDASQRSPSALTQEEIQQKLDHLKAVPGLGQTRFEFLRHGNEAAVQTALIEATQSEEPGIRMGANYLLFRLRNDPETRLEAILGALESIDDSDLQLSKFYLLELDYARDAEFLPYLLDAVSSENSYGRAVVVEALGRFAFDLDALTVILEATTDGEASVRKSAAIALGSAVGCNEALVQDPDVLAALLGLTEDQDRYVREEAFHALVPHGSVEETMEAFMQALSDDDVRITAMRCLAQIGPVETVLPVLLDAMDDPDEHVRLGAVVFLEALGPDSEVISTLIGIVERREDTWHRACCVLATLGPDAADAVPCLIDALDEPDDLAAIWALAAIGPSAEPAVPILGSMIEIQLLPMTGSMGHGRMSSAIKALGQIGGAATEYIPRILELAERPEPGHQLAEIEALGRFGEEAQWTAPVLLDLLDEEVLVSRKLVIHLALFRMGHNPEASLEAIISVAESGQTHDIFNSARILGEIGPPAAEALPLLNEYLEYCDTEARQKIQAYIDAIEGTEPLRLYISPFN